MSLSKRLLAEFIGTFWLVFGGCGSAVVAAVFVPKIATPMNLGIGFVGVAFAFGLTVMTMAFAIGHISGCHLNPAVSVGLCVAGRFGFRDLIPYILAQVFGGIVAAGVLLSIMVGKDNPENKSVAWGPLPQAMEPGAFATNGYGKLSPGKFSLPSCALAEAVLTFMFLMIILGSTDKRAPAGFAPIAIGLGLTLIHLIGIPITNLSVNPARSTGPALALIPAAGEIPEHVKQLWLFWTAPIVGAILAGLVYPALSCESKPRTVTGEPAGAMDRWPKEKKG